MSAIGPPQIIAMFETLAAALEADKDRLGRLDGAIGDGDHGVTMATGFAAITSAMRQVDAADTDPTALFGLAAKSFLNAVGASSGPLYATAFLRAGAVVKGRASLDRDAMVAVLGAMARGIQERGKGERGDKTMLDAWLPAAEAAERACAGGATLNECLEAARDAAAAGAEATRPMIAAKGRAARLGERARGNMDPGAASTATILAALAAFPPVATA